MKTFKTTVEAEFHPDAIEVAEAFWSMCEEEQCYFFEHIHKIAGHKLAIQLQYVIDSKFFTPEAKAVMGMIGDYSKWKTKS